MGIGVVEDNILFDLNKEKYNVILDTDIGNSWDDQFALVYLLKSEDIFNLEAITIEPFIHNENESIIDNQKISYNEILNIGQLLDKDLTKKTYKFHKNKTVDKIIEIANKNKKTYILAIGALTNIKLAIDKDSSIINKIEIIWLGGNSIEYGNNEEFNFMQDINATRRVINSNVNITIIPARNVAIDLMISLSELESKLNMKDAISKYLCNRFLNDSFYGIKKERVIWDISVIAYLINKNWFTGIKISCPNIKDDASYELTNNNHKITMIKDIDAIKVYEDFFNKLG